MPGAEDSGRPLVELTHVEKHYGDLHVLKDINLTVKKGDTKLATRINNAIADMIQDGSWQRAISDNTKGTAYTPNAKYNPPEPTEGEK